MSPAIRRAEVVLAAVTWAVLVLSLTAVVLTIPAVTRVLVDWLDVADGCGLTEAEARRAAESVRAFVSSERAEDLPRTIAGREAFDDRAVAHLLDVRDALRLSRTAAGVSALVLAVWIGVAAARKRWDAVGRGTEAGGWATLGIVLAAGILGVSGFDRFFAWFHGLLFEEGTWLFPADSLLIQLFPERFWIAVGGFAVALAALGGAVLVMSGRRLRMRSTS
jgi:integral membrane protein (TIGR01906 family)